MKLSLQVLIGALLLGWKGRSGHALLVLRIWWMFRAGKTTWYHEIIIAAIYFLILKYKAMFFGIHIFIHVLFIACMVFIIGYVFGSFSKKKSLTTITRVAAILVIVLFIAGHFFFRGYNMHHSGLSWHMHQQEYDQSDSTWHH